MWLAVKARCADPGMTSCMTSLLPSHRMLAIVTAYVACLQIEESSSCGAAFGAFYYTLIMGEVCKALVALVAGTAVAYCQSMVSHLSLPLSK